MQQEAPQEFVGGERHLSLFVAMRVILPSERDFAIGYVQQPVVRDRDTVRIACQVVQYMLRSTERRLGVDYPVLTEQRPEKGAKCSLGSDGLESSGKLKLPTAE